MGLVEWARSPWGENVPIHIAFFLLWVSAIADLLFLIGHAIWVRYFARAAGYNGYKVRLMRNLMKRAIRGVEEATWA
jgi:hypothetical protein